MIAPLGTTRGGGHGLDAEKAAGGQLISDAQYYVEDCENAALRANGTKGKPRVDKQPLVVAHALKRPTKGEVWKGDGSDNFVYEQHTYSIVPEGGQGADLRASEVQVSTALDSVNANEHDRGVRVVSFVSENQRAELRETPYARQLTKGGGKPGQGYPMVREALTVRRLMPVECERLQSLPDGWTDLGKTKDAPRFSALGDAVTVNVAEWIGRRILEVDGVRDE